ncbi:hypothetical protein [Pseudonocardia kunmingensis]|uniref:Extradiol ring-cleavage dioxygenase LigAB LigA subunit domain-containing protein n=1 Tax=Pseudonocardia kunmingensis TaxID=630975 RepID=A0A543DQI8_9PSEU|nr:hypothetical protein [Pseudonocardia kunmingensis]TQM11601.1 hypothetical protein FB558_4166 [Pseudonocardia kunmingensis]
MSRHAVNAFMRLVNMDRDSLAGYVADPPRFVARYVERGGFEAPPWVARGGPLTETERQALAARDYGALYAMGAHPYLLWSFAEAVWVPEVSRAELVEDFRAKALQAGHPSYES